MKRKTQEQYIAELQEKNPTIKLIGEYIDANTKILHHCVVHDIDWMTTPSRALRGVGCQQCKTERFIASNTKTTEQYKTELKTINTNVEVLAPYVNARIPILHRCLIDGTEWSAAPTSLLHGHGCPTCGNKIASKKLSKTHDEYIQELLIINPNIIVLEKYINMEEKILHKCLIDGHEWMAKPGNILHGKGCPKCAGNLQPTHEEYLDRLKKLGSTIIPLEEYISVNTSILHKCLVDGYEWKTTPASTLQGCGCPKCAGILQKTQEEYIAEVLTINPDIEVLGEYSNSREPILHRCRIDGYEWIARPSNILNGQGCPQCRESRGERRIRQWLRKNNYNYKFQHRFDDCKDKQTLPFDFYLPDDNMCIEYDGQGHYWAIDFNNSGTDVAQANFETTQYHDMIKTNYCNNKNIRLLRISYFEDVNEKLESCLLNIVT